MKTSKSNISHLTQSTHDFLVHTTTSRSYMTTPFTQTATFTSHPFTCDHLVQSTISCSNMTNQLTQLHPDSHVTILFTCEISRSHMTVPFTWPYPVHTMLCPPHLGCILLFRGEYPLNIRAKLTSAVNHHDSYISVSAGQEIVPSRIGKEVNIFVSNWWAMMVS